MMRLVSNGGSSAQSVAERAREVAGQPAVHLSPQGVEILLREQVGVLRFAPADWKQYEDQIVRVEIAAFGADKAFSRQGLYSGMCAPTTRALLLKEQVTDSVIGYTYAFCDRLVPYICNTAIDPRYQGRKLVQPLMEELEGWLREAGYDKLSRTARVADGYADKIIRSYGKRVLEVGDDFPTIWGPLRPIVVRI